MQILRGMKDQVLNKEPPINSFLSFAPLCFNVLLVAKYWKALQLKRELTVRRNHPMCPIKKLFFRKTPM